MEKKIFIYIQLIIIGFLISGCAARFPNSSMGLPSTAQADPTVSLWQGNPSAVWSKLQPLSLDKLTALQHASLDSIQSAWVNLAIISKSYSNNTQLLVDELIRWRAGNPNHPGNKLFPANPILQSLSNSSPPQNIALILPQSGLYRNAGQTVRAGFLNAYYAKVTDKPNIKFYDMNTSTNMPALYQKAVSEGAAFVIGPLVKSNVAQLKNYKSFNVPTLALNYTDSNTGASANFYEFGLLPEDEVMQLANRARHGGLSKAIVIAPQNIWGKRLYAAFTQQWQALGGSIEDSWFYNDPLNYNQEIARLLRIDPGVEKIPTGEPESNSEPNIAMQRRRDFDVIILFAQPQPGRSIVSLLRTYLMDMPIYATSSVYSGKPMPAKDRDLDGVIVCDIPWTREAGLPNHPTTPTNRLYAVGRDAYLLSQTLTRLVMLPNFPVYGATGALVMTPSQQIRRRIPCAAFQNGIL